MDAASGRGEDRMEISVNVIRRGQPKPYADSVLECQVHFSEPKTEKMVRSFARWLHNQEYGQSKFADEAPDASEESRFFTPHLVLSGSGHDWVIKITEHYTG